MTTLAASYRFCAERVRGEDPAAYAATLLFPPARRRQFQALEALRLCTGDIIAATSVSDAAQGEAQMRECAAVLRSGVGEGRRRASDGPTWVPAAADTFSGLGLDPAIYDRYVDAVAVAMRTGSYETHEAHVASIVPMAEAGADLIVPTLHLDPSVYRATAIEVLVASEISYRLRDLSRNRTLGRLHLPLSDLRGAGIEPETPPEDPRWVEVVRQSVVRTRLAYRESEAGLAVMDPVRRRLVGIAMAVSEAWLDRVEAAGQRVMKQPPRLGIGRQMLAAGRAVFRNRAVV